ncbi:MAG: carbamate kinase [Bauldia sp.]
MRIVIALGGNALLRRGEPMSAAAQEANVRSAVAALAPIIAVGHHVAITHGNGPQVGLLALQNPGGDGSFPLDVLGAETEGMIGYLVERELAARLPSEDLIATLLTQVRVAADDPAFARPSKPIGPSYDEETARRLAAQHGWSVGLDGKGWRRLVPSPRPQEILAAKVIEMLFDLNVTVICAGGGGIPIVEDDGGMLRGVEAVVDKDFASSLLARRLGADLLMLLTDVDAVYSGWGTEQAMPLASVCSRDLDPGMFPPGSMRPKVEAAMEFAVLTGRPAAIGALADAEAILRGERGTRILP